MSPCAVSWVRRSFKIPSILSPWICTCSTLPESSCSWNSLYEILAPEGKSPSPEVSQKNMTVIKRTHKRRLDHGVEGLRLCCFPCLGSGLSSDVWNSEPLFSGRPFSLWFGNTLNFVLKVIEKSDDVIYINDEVGYMRSMRKYRCFRSNFWTKIFLKDYRPEALLWICPKIRNSDSWSATRDCQICRYSRFLFESTVICRESIS